MKFIYVLLRVSVPRNFTLNLDGTILGVAWDPPPDLSVSSYTLTCYVSGSEVLSLETSLVNVTLGVYMTSATYSCNVYATTSSGEGHPTDDLSVTTGGNLVAHIKENTEDSVTVRHSVLMAIISLVLGLLKTKYMHFCV